MSERDHERMLLERAIEIAVEAHHGQVGKDGLPYVLHPLRIMARMETVEEQIVAALHDVVEDSEITFDDLRREGFSEYALEAVALLTHDKEKVPYDDYVRRIKPHALARKVKLADLEDNSNLRRLAQVEDKDLERVRKYHRAWRILTG
jgi:(p)ppGpp synthase/HD superfamily hydrolase